MNGQTRAIKLAKATLEPLGKRRLGDPFALGFGSGHAAEAIARKEADRKES